MFFNNGEMRQFFLLVILAVTAAAGIELRAQTTVTYVQQTGNYHTTWGDGGGAYNNGGTEVGMWANTGSIKQVVSWRKFKTAGDNTGSDRALQVGDKFTLTVAACRAYGRIGCALLSSPSTGSWANRESNYAVSVNLDGPTYAGGWGVWYIRYKNDSVAIASFGGVQGTYYDYKFEFTLTAPDRMNITISDNNGHSSSFFDVFLNTSNPITDYSIFMQDDFDGGFNKNIYWKQPTTVTNTKAVVLGASNKSFAVTGSIPNGLDAASVTIVSENSLDKSGTGTLTLGACSYSGTTYVAGGTLQLSGNLSSSGTTVQGSTLRIIGDVSLSQLNNKITGVVIVDPGKSLTIPGTLLNSAGNSGLVIKSDASSTGSLLHGSASVAATVERYVANDLKWHFLSSPVASQAIWPQFAPAPAGSPLNFGASPWNWDLYYWNPNASLTTDQYWVNLRLDNGDYNSAPVDQTGSNAGFGSSTPPVFATGRGYLCAYSTGWTTGSPTTHTFAGTLHQGSISHPITTGVNTFNLAGNPYPSSVDWKAAAGWTRDNLVLNGSGYDYWIFNDNAGNYGVFNSADLAGTNGVSRYIAPGQAFFVKAGATGSLGMTDAVRCHSTQAWLKEGVVSTGSVSLTLSTQANSYSDEMIIAFNPEVAEGGSEKMASFYAEAPEIWSPAGGRDLSVVRYFQPGEDQTVPVSIRTGITSGYTLTARDIASFTLAGQVVLEDLETGHTQDLKLNPVYAFTSQAGADPGRFLLHFHNITGTGNPSHHEALNIFSYGSLIRIGNIPEKDRGGRVGVYNMTGQEIASGEIRSSPMTLRLQSPPGWYVVQVLSGYSTHSKKVFIH